MKDYSISQIRSLHDRSCVSCTFLQDVQYIGSSLQARLHVSEVSQVSVGMKGHLRHSKTSMQSYIEKFSILNEIHEADLSGSTIFKESSNLFPHQHNPLRIILWQFILFNKLLCRI